jgi:Na+/proline symporter
LIVSFSVMLITYFANQYIMNRFIHIAKNKKRNRYFDIST